ncbi:MAG: hypothetical protein R3E85_07550 [Planctomycetota bacterium]
MGNPHLPGFTPRLFVDSAVRGRRLALLRRAPRQQATRRSSAGQQRAEGRHGPRIVGFASFELLRAEINPGDDGDDDEDDDGQDHIQLFIRKLPATIFPTNLSAVAAPGLADLPRWLTDQLADLNATIDEPAKRPPWAARPPEDSVSDTTAIRFLVIAPDPSLEEEFDIALEGVKGKR